MSQLQLNMEEKVIQTKFSCRAYTSKYCIIRVIKKFYDREAGVQFVNHEHDYGQNWTSCYELIITVTISEHNKYI